MNQYSSVETKISKSLSLKKRPVAVKFLETPPQGASHLHGNPGGDGEGSRHQLRVHRQSSLHGHGGWRTLLDGAGKRSGARCG